MLRSGLSMLINSQKDMEVVGEGSNQVEAISMVQKHQPDLVSLDLSMPGGGAKLIETLCREFPKVRVLVLTMHDDPAYVRIALAAGAAGYVVKKAADTELLTAIRTIAKGGMYAQISNDGPETQLQGPAKVPNAKKSLPLDTLSEREREVLSMVSQGHTNQAIANKLFLSVKTIESYRARLMAKLGLKNRAELTTFAMETGILSSDPRLENQTPEPPPSVG